MPKYKKKSSRRSRDDRHVHAIVQVLTRDTMHVNSHTFHRGIDGAITYETHREIARDVARGIATAAESYESRVRVI